MSTLRILYLGLAIAGALVPLTLVLPWLSEHGWSIGAMIDHWAADPASKALVWGMVLSALTLSLFIIAELQVRKDSLCLIAIPATFCIGIACGLPLYLFLRSRQLD